MTLQTLTIGKQKFVLMAKRDFQKLAAQAQKQTENEFWTQAALHAEAASANKNEKSIPFEAIERALDLRKNRAPDLLGKPDESPGQMADRIPSNRTT